MSVFFVVLGIVFMASIVFFLVMARAFRNPVRKHQYPEQAAKLGVAELRIPTSNNKQLYGWWHPAKPEAPLLILIHGWGRNIERMLPYWESFNNEDYNLMAFDSRNHGNSDEDTYSTMLKFAEDILSCIDYAQQELKLSASSVHLVGLSIGGSAAIYAASRDHRISKVATVGAFAYPGEVMRKQLSDRNIPGFLIWAVIKYIELRVGFKFDDIAPVNNISHADAQFLLIHGKDDQVVLVDQAMALKKADSKEKVETWIINNKGHSDCHFEEGYWQKLRAFISD